MSGHAPRVSLLLLVAMLCIVSAATASEHTLASQPAPRHTFDLTVSLEWQPGAKDLLPKDLSAAGCAAGSALDLYLDDLTQGLRETSAYLYTYSEGQLALGNVTIYTGGEHWEAADIRILADNAYRPTAFVGGIVATRQYYVSPKTHKGIFFAPGEIFLGRLWNGKGGRCGGWSEAPGWRTIGHEWAHYALFLFDEYYNESTHAEQYCTSGGLGLLSPGATVPGTTDTTADSLMAYHYTADKLWLKDTPAPAVCGGTPQSFFHGESDWQTTARFYTADSVTAPATIDHGPAFAGSPAEALFKVTLGSSPPAIDRTTALVKLAPLSTPRQVGQAYLIRPNPDTPWPRRILAQGDLPAGLAGTFWGAQNGDRGSVIVQNWATGERFYTAPSITPGVSTLLTAVPGGWRPSLTITPVVVPDPFPGVSAPSSKVTGIQVHLQDCDLQAKRIVMIYCPAGGDCDTPVFVAQNPVTFAFDHTFTPTRGPAAHGYVYAAMPGSTNETVAWYQLSGGVGPAHTDGHASLVDGLVNVDPSPAVSPTVGDAQALYSPAQACTLPANGLPPGIVGIVGDPFLVQPVVPSDNGGTPWSPKEPPLLVRLSYNQDLLDQLGIGEASLVVLRLTSTAAGQPVWQSIPTAGRSVALDWIEAREQVFSGRGEIYALGYRAPAAFLPAIQR